MPWFHFGSLLLTHCHVIRFMDAAEQRTWRLLRAQAIVELDSFLRHVAPDVPLGSQAMQLTSFHGATMSAGGKETHNRPVNAVRRFDNTPTSTCSDLGKYLSAYAIGATSSSSGDLPLAQRLGLSPTSTRDELPALDGKQLQEGYHFGSLTLDEIPEFRSYTMPELLAMEYQRSKNTTLASMPEMGFEDDDPDEDEDQPEIPSAYKLQMQTKTMPDLGNIGTFVDGVPQVNRMPRFRQPGTGQSAAGNQEGRFEL
ncbi:unnamed protein product [Effrenium voratum]|nr:unnamed protein product [Effrenium voratum]